MMELWDIYDEKRKHTGKMIVRGEKLGENEYHLVVHMWILNSKGQFLIQKRASGVKSMPNMWAATGGAAVAGDNSYDACKREVFEEIGIEADMSQAEVVLTIMREDSISDVWVIKQDFGIEECTLQVEEVSEVKWATALEIKEMISEGIFHNYRYVADIFRLVE